MNRITFAQFGGVVILWALGAAPVGAQEPPVAGPSQELAPSAQESASPAAPRRGLFGRSLIWAKNAFDGSAGTKDGVYPDLGGLIPGAGFLRGGAGVRHGLFGGAAVWDASAVVSATRYAAVQSTVEWPHLFSNRFSLAAQVKYTDSTQINYFGIGPDTAKSAQTDYRMQNIDINGSGTLRPRDWLAVGGRIGYLSGPGVEPGLSSLHPSTDQHFDEATAPGLTSMVRYLHADGFIETDSRDVPGYPTRGGVYRLGLAAFSDLDGSSHSFSRVDMDAAHYVPIFHKNWVVAVRGRVTLSQTAAGNDVPFYLLPTLGGSNSLRGYVDYRFRDRDAALLSAEYRWPLFRMMDAALFMDAGTVAPAPSELWRAHLNRDYGLGIRLHSATRLIARLDVAKGAEGIGVIASFSAPFGASRRTVSPYVP